MNKQLQKLKLQVSAWASLVSIVLCVIALIVWLASFAVGVQVSVRNGAGVRYAILSVPNSVGWVTDRGEPPANISFDAVTQPAKAEPDLSDPLHWYWKKPVDHTLGFGHSYGEGIVQFNEVNSSRPCKFYGHFCPGWGLVLLFAAGPMMWLTAQRRRAYRYEHDLCIYCGSDMSTSPYRCPKCGREQPW